MIRSFKSSEAESVFNGQHVRSLHPQVQRAAQRKLYMLDAAVSLDVLASVPGNRLEPLLGDRQGQYSIRINLQWRIVFRWESDGAHDVEIVDYH